MKRPHAAIKDLTGQKFGLLTALERTNHFTLNRQSFWICQCDCGNVVEIRTDRLTKSKYQSCGCIKTSRAHNSAKFAFGQKSHKYHQLYKVYRGMLDRCHANGGIKNYGKRGIQVCDYWQEAFGTVNFMEWAIENGWRPGLEIDRIDVNGNYKPSNCRFVTRRVNSNNKRNTIKVPINGTEISIYEFLETYMTDFTYKTIMSRYERGWSWVRILGTPPMRFPSRKKKEKMP